MANRTPIDQLNDAVEALIANRDAQPSPPGTGLDLSLAPLVSIAADLRGLPGESFKARLKADLALTAETPTYTDLLADAGSEQGRGPMTTKATPAPVSPTVTMYLCCKDASAAIDFYKRAFGARETMRLTEPGGGRIGHAEVMIGNTTIMLADEYPEYGIVGPESLGGSPVTIHLNVDDVDAVADQAVSAGAKLIAPVADQFYGDRSGRIADPFGHVWVVATHKEYLTADEVQRRFDAMMQAESAAAVKPVPEGFHTITPYLQVVGAGRLIEFLKDAFGAEDVLKVPLPDGSIMHAEVRVGDSIVELADAGGEVKAMPAAIHLYVDDADSVYERAIAAGGVSLHAPQDQEYGERSGGVRDPLGNNWYIGTLKPVHDPARFGLRTVTPYFHPRGADKLIDFLTRAFNAEIAARHAQPDGTVAHAKIKIGDSILEMGEAHGQWQPMPSALHLYVNDADAVYQSALDAGATSFFEPRDEPYGDRVGGVTDEFDNVWYIATHKKDVSFDAHADEQEAPRIPAVKPIREGFHAITPYLVLEEADELIEFCKQAFGATELHRGTGSAGGTHYEIRIGDSMLMIGGKKGIERKVPSAIYLYVEDVDAVYARAVSAGATAMVPPADQPYGDRNAFVKDPFGNEWYIATHVKDVT